VTSYQLHILNFVSDSLELTGRKIATLTYRDVTSTTDTNNDVISVILTVTSHLHVLTMASVSLRLTVP